jgi:hypothetical protein
MIRTAMSEPHWHRWRPWPRNFRGKYQLRDAGPGRMGGALRYYAKLVIAQVVSPTTPTFTSGISAVVCVTEDTAAKTAAWSLLWEPPRGAHLL